jgi:hypothetical protein
MPDDPVPTDEEDAADPDASTPLDWLNDQDAFLKRYVLSLILAPPPSRRPRNIPGLFRRTR